MKHISFMLDTASGIPSDTRPQQGALAPFRVAAAFQGAPIRRSGSMEITLPVQLPEIGLDVDACAAFDRRPPLEAMVNRWLTRQNVVTMYDCGHDTDSKGSVYDTVFRLQGYVWIRSPAPILKDLDADF